MAKKNMSGSFDELRILVNGQIEIDKDAINKRIDQLEKQVKKFKIPTDNKDFSKEVEKLKKQLISLAAQGKGTTSQLRQIGQALNLNPTTESVEKAKKKIDALKVSNMKLNTELKNTSQSAMTLGESLRTALVKFGIWMGASTIFFQSLRFFSDGIKYVNELDKSLTQIAIVTGKTREQLRDLGKEYKNLAYDMGVLTKEIADASVEFYRQGLSQAEVMERVKIATQYAKISNLEFTQAAEILTATTNSMNISIEKASDVFAYLGDATATGADEIGVAFQKVGGTAGALGVNFEKVASWLAVVSSKSRESAETIGTSFKTILARYGKLTEAGFDEEDGTKINDVAKALSSVGIALTDARGEFRNFGDVTDELGKKWDSLDKRTQSYLATTIAGVRQQSRFYNLMQGYSESVTLYDKALKAAGQTQEKFDVYQQGIEAHLNRLKDAWTGVWQDSFNSEDVKTAIDSLTSLASSVGVLVEKFGVIKPLIFSISAGLIGFTKTGKEMRNWVGEFIPAIGNLNTRLKTSTTTIKLFGIEMNTAKVAAIGLQTALTLGLSLAITGVTYLIQKYAEKNQELKQEQEEIQKQNDQLVNSWKNNNDEINQLINKYEELSKIKNKNNQQEKEYINVQNRLNDLMPVLTKNIDEKGNAQLKSIELIKEEIQYVKDLKTNYDKLTLAKFEENLVDHFDKVKKIQDKIKQLSNNREGEIKTSLGDVMYVPNSDETKLKIDQQILQQRGQLKRLEQEIVDFVKSQTEAYIDLDGNLNKLNKTDREYINTLIEESKIRLDSKENIEFLTNQMADYANILAYARENQGKLSSSDFNHFRKSMDNLGLSVDMINHVLEIYMGTLDDTNKSLQDQILTIQQFQKQVKESSDELNLLNKAQKELDENGKLSQDTLDKLVSNYDDFIKATGLSENSIYSFIAAKKDEKTAFIQTEIDKTNTLIEETKKRIQAMDLERNKLLELINANPGNEFLVKSLKNVGKSLRESLSELDNLTGKRTYFQKTLDNFLNPNSSPSSSNSKYDPNDKYKEQLALIEDINHQIDMQNEKLRFASDSDKIAILEEQNKLYNKLKQELHALNEARKQERSTLDKSSERYQELTSQIQQTSLEWWKLDNAQNSNLDTIKNIQKTYINDVLDKEINRMEKKNALLKEEEERQKRLLDIANQQKVLDSTLKEKNVYMLQENGEFDWVADPRKVREEKDKLQQLKDDYKSWESDIKYQKQLDALKTFKEEFSNQVDELSIDNLSTIQTMVNNLSNTEKTGYADRLQALRNFINTYNSLNSQIGSSNTNLTFDSSPFKNAPTLTFKAPTIPNISKSTSSNVDNSMVIQNVNIENVQDYSDLINKLNQKRQVSG